MNLLVSEAPVAPLLSAVQQSTACLIVNRRSFRASRKRLAGNAIAIATRHGAEIVEADDPASLSAGLERCIAQGCERLIVLAGDGTVQFVVDHLARLPAATPRPQLLLLGGGRTNLSAGDVNGRGALLDKLDAALQDNGADSAFHLEERHTLCVEQSPAPPRHGFFIAGALIDSAIRACQEHRQSGAGWHRTGHGSTGWSLLKLAILGLLGRSPLPPYPDLDIEAPGLGVLHGPTRVLIATTLLHRSGLFDPYADRGEGSLRTTTIALRAPGFWRRLAGILVGRFSRRMELEQGFLSGRCHSLRVVGLGGYTLDGENFDTDPARPVVIRPGPRLQFLVP